MTIPPLEGIFFGLGPSNRFTGVYFEQTLLLCLGRPDAEALLQHADEALPVGYGLRYKNLLK